MRKNKNQKKLHFVYHKPKKPEFKVKPIYPYGQGFLRKIWAPFAVVAITLVGYFASQSSTPAGQTLKGSLFGKQNTIDGPGLTDPQPLKGAATTNSFLTLLVGWGNFILPYITVLAVLSLIYGAILFLTSGGNTEKIDKGKRIIFWSVVAIILALSSYAIVYTLVNFNA